ncbi:MAG: transporter protein [Nocardioides sp.]|nr:transporter protein [Nocardioides sp.]
MTPPPAGARTRALLLVLCGAIFLEGIDVAMLNVAVPSIRAELDLGTSTAQWVISAYVLGYGGFMLLGGRCADLLGRRRVFLAGLVVFLLFSGVGGLAGEGWVVVVARFVTGVAAAFMTPAGLSIITTSFEEGAARNRALVAYGATGAAGFTIGLVAGGLLTEIGWRWVFFAPVLLGSVVLALGVAVIRRDDRTPGHRPAREFDLPGAVGVTAGMVALVYGLVHVGEPGDRRTQGLVAIGVAVVLLAGFVLVERRVGAPLLRLGLLRNGTLVRADLAAVLFAAAFFGFQFVVSLYLQELRGWTPVRTGLAFLVMGLDLVLAPVLTPGLVRRFGTMRVVLAGSVCAAVAYALFLRLDDGWGYLDMLPALTLVGVAFALAYGPLTIAATDGVTESEQGVAGGLLNTSFQFGAALGLAVVTSVLLAGDDVASLDDYRAALLAPALLAALGALVIASGLRPRTRTAPTVRSAAAPRHRSPGSRQASPVAPGATGTVRRRRSAGPASRPRRTARRPDGARRRDSR